MHFPARLALLEETSMRELAVSLQTAPFSAECCNWHKAVQMNTGSPWVCCYSAAGMSVLNKMFRGCAAACRRRWVAQLPGQRVGPP